MSTAKESKTEKTNKICPICPEEQERRIENFFRKKKFPAQAKHSRNKPLPLAVPSPKPKLLPSRGVRQTKTPAVLQELHRRSSVDSWDILYPRMRTPSLWVQGRHRSSRSAQWSLKPLPVSPWRLRGELAFCIHLTVTRTAPFAKNMS